MTEEPVTSVELEHHFDAPRERVWNAWTHHESVSAWWGSQPGGVVTSAALDVRPGGRFEISFTDPDGDRHTCSGSYLTVQAPALLDFTWSWKSEPGITSRVTVAFADEGTGTAMRFVHGDLRGVSEHGYAEGWRRTFAKLDGFLATRG